MKHTHLALAITIATASLLAGCDKSSQQENATAATQQQIPPAIVDVIPVNFQTVPQIQTFSGRTSAYQSAEVRPQVSGIIDEILFTEGDNIKKNQPLYRINADNYDSSIESGKATVEQAQANLSTAEANYNSSVAELNSRQASLLQAQADLERLEGLIEINAISQQQYQQAITAYRTAQAAVQVAQANIAKSQAAIENAKANISAAQSGLESSELNLNRTIVRAPISGRSGLSNVTVGTLVNANQSTPLVSISQLNPIYVDISQSSSDLLKLRQQINSGKAQPGLTNVELVLEDGSIYPQQGRLTLAEAKVDKTTGSVTLRAIFPNDNNILLPGMYVTARLIQSIIPNAVLLPQSAIMRTPKGDTQVYIVDKDNKIQIRPVTVKGTYEGDWIVTDGLQSGEQVVVTGGAKVQPEQQVKSRPIQIDSAQQLADESAPSQNGATAPMSPQQAAKNLQDKDKANQTNNKSADSQAHQ